MRTTITDVAKQAGVSMKTVSRVLNNEPNVAKATRERVMAVAEQLDYSPNLAARGLASSKSYLIALLYDNASPSYLTKIQRGAIEACRPHGYHLLLEPMTVEQANGPDVERLLRRMNADGAILTPPLCDLPGLRDRLKQLDIRYVTVGPEDADDAPSVRMDDWDAAFQMATYLIECGHRDIGFVAGHPDHASSHFRRAGFEAALQQAGLDLPEHRVAQGDYGFRSGMEAGSDLLSDTTSRPSAVFASNDDMAAGVLSVANRLGIAVPESLSVCGFDDTPIACILWPQLTTVAQPIRQMGRKAAQTLIQPKEPDTPVTHTFDYELIIRGSTASPS
ncbi:MAG: LacI family DNA-binding transcriptional regulator [Pseudomonadota bacterium]